MAKTELKRIEIVRAGDVAISNYGIRLDNSWNDLNEIAKQALGITSDNEVEELKFNGKITIVIEEVGVVSHNLNIKSTMQDCTVTTRDDISHAVKLGKSSVHEIINYLENPGTVYNGRLYPADSTRVQFSDISALELADGTIYLADSNITIE